MSLSRLDDLEAREMIKELTARYAWHAARAEVEDLLSLFTPDGRFLSPHAGVLAVDELRPFFGRNLTPGDRIPMVMNHILSVDRACATGSCTMFSPWSPGGPLCGFYSDRFRRMEEGWRFEERSYREYSRPEPATGNNRSRKSL